MTVIRIEHQENFVTISKFVLEDINLSFKAKGLWAYCMSRPNQWHFHVSHLATVSKDGKDSVYSALKELESNGYLRRVQKNENGKFGTVEYVVSEFKKFLPHRDLPHPGFPHPVNPPLVNIDKEQREIYSNPPLPPPKKSPPSKEEEEELEKRLRERPKDSPKIHSRKKWQEAVLEDIRKDELQKRETIELIKKHREQAKKYDMKTHGPWNVYCCENFVELVHGSRSRRIAYDLPDQIWIEQTRWINEEMNEIT
jgi:hypothetical protein